MCFGANDGVTLVEVMVIVVVLGLTSALVYYGIMAVINANERGKHKVEAVSLLKAATEALTISDLSLVIGLETSYTADWIPDAYAITYTVTNTSHGVYSLEVQVTRDDRVLAKNKTLVHK
ncbi:MAG: hypothetical protein PHP20_10205 [Firmicutes bacterium]|jgi:type II secretory pathway pseudopilin PulG|nr:hypothetical protein [Bacillota bacterium]MDD4337641.1 hypothetical protein [Bacillota bacterium]MDD4793423.1 hypothetical protein [Bacillota bacterium]